MTAYWLKLGDAAPPSAWATLQALSDRVADDPTLPPVVPDDFLYAARVERAGLPDLHVFRHVLTGGYLDVDDLGGLWRFVGRGSGAEGYAQVATLADALTRAGLERAERLALRTRRGPRRLTAITGSGLFRAPGGGFESRGADGAAAVDGEREDSDDGSPISSVADDPGGVDDASDPSAEPALATA
jgi:hypothetical protein